MKRGNIEIKEIVYGLGRKRTGQHIKCETCGKEFYVNPARIRQVKKQGNVIRYCGMKCYVKTGNKNPFWGKKHSKETKQKFSENPNRVYFKKGSKNPNFSRFNDKTFVGSCLTWWQRFLKKTIGKCESCGYNKHIELLEVHHLDKNKNNNVRENLKLLCPNCHEEWHLLDKSGRYSSKK